MLSRDRHVTLLANPNIVLRDGSSDLRQTPPDTHVPETSEASHELRGWVSVVSARSARLP
eukprot:2456326-Rhodomonas_salina.4